MCVKEAVKTLTNKLIIYYSTCLKMVVSMLRAQRRWWRYVCWPHCNEFEHQMGEGESSIHRQLKIIFTTFTQ